MQSHQRRQFDLGCCRPTRAHASRTIEHPGRYTQTAHGLLTIDGATKTAGVATLDYRVDIDLPTKPRVPRIEHLHLLGHMGLADPACTITCARTRVSATWRRRSSRQGIKGARPARAPLGQHRCWPPRCKARQPRIQNQTVFGRPQRVKGDRKNWYEHETTTTNDTPQEGRK